MPAVVALQPPSAGTFSSAEGARPIGPSSSERFVVAASSGSLEKFTN